MTVRQLIDVAEEIRATSGSPPVPKIPIESPTPPLNEWRVFDHSAVVTRTYACLAVFIESALADWLAAMPAMWLAYSELPEVVQRQHFEGLGRLLSQHGFVRHRGVNWIEAMGGLLKGLESSGEYSIKALEIR